MQMNSSIIYLTFCLIVIKDLCHETICIPLYMGSYANTFSFMVPLAPETAWSLVSRYYLKDKRWFLIRYVYASFGLYQNEMLMREHICCLLLLTMGKIFPNVRNWFEVDYC